MQFSVLASLLVAGTAMALPAQTSPAATIGEPMCTPIMDIGQTLKTDDCREFLAILKEEAKLPGFACNRMFAPKGEWVLWKQHKSCLVQTIGNSGSQQCLHPKVVAPALDSLINKCSNQWGYIDVSQVAIKGDTLATGVRLYQTNLG